MDSTDISRRRRAIYAALGLLSLFSAALIVTRYVYSSEALFGGTLSFSGFSTDAVDIVWGLTPAVVAAVPEPSTWLLMVAGLAAMTRLQQRRNS